MNAKTTASIAMMSALGTLLSAFSLHVTFGGGAALDLSHIATFVAAIFGGPLIGAIVGFTCGIYAGYYFGYVAGTLGILSVISMPLGKGLTGLVAGLLYKKLKIGSSSKASTLTVPIVLLSYVPECLFTIAYFLTIVPYFYGYSMAFMIPLVIPKAWIEITVMSLMMGALAGNIGFKEFISRSLSTKVTQLRSQQTKKS
jgi:LytS/YehU family sensor histidine kinase